jgi:hypothetical protein
MLDLIVGLIETWSWLNVDRLSPRALRILAAIILAVCWMGLGLIVFALVVWVL